MLMPLIVRYPSHHSQSFPHPPLQLTPFLSFKNTCLFFLFPVTPIPPMKEAHTLRPTYPRPPSSTMSTTGSFDQYAHKASKKVAHHRHNDSGELDVFEAARYFSSIPDIPSGERLGWVGGRRSLDLSMQYNPHHSYSHRLEKHHPKEKRSNKQPSSPGAKLASFLNSLFNQASSKKKKSKSGGAQSARDEEGSPKDRRKRRSSISYFQSRSTKDSQSMCSSSGSAGFRTPPPKVLREVSLPRCNVQPRSVTVYPSDEAFDEKQDLGWGCMDGEIRFKDGFGEIPSKERGLKKDGGEAADHDQNGWESDSSSDLFELKNYDLGLYSNGLPVYETTLVGPVK